MNSIRLKDITTFTKLSISLPIALTAFTGYSLFAEKLSWYGALVACGIFFLSAGASALNQFQEVNEDSKMARTHGRPLPKHRFGKDVALSVIISAVITGTLLLIPFGWPTVLWGWMGLVWYNLIYTPLKKRTAFSVFPGAIVGAIPPIAGWVAAGGSILDVRIHFIAFFFFLGQMPHFWLLVLKYKKQYKKAGFPIITDHLSDKQLIRVIFIWILCTYLATLLLPLNFVLSKPLLIVVLLASISISFILTTRLFIRLFYNQQQSNLKNAFLYFNIFYLMVILTINLAVI